MATKKKAAAKKSAKAPAKAAPSATVEGAYRASKVYKGPRKVSADQLPSQFSRADLEFIGVDHAGASYEGRVYINNPSANTGTETTAANGYAGSFYIFGHGGCFGDVGHCDVSGPRDDFDPRPSHPLEPIKKVVIATEAIRNAVGQSPDIHVTVVPVVMSWTEKTDTGDVCKFDHINLVTYD